jgi:CRP/FNR family transcriptional regulator, cyclic AMP receptor protein
MKAKGSGKLAKLGETPKFDVKAFLSSVGSGRSTEKYQRKKIIFRQGDPADGVFYIQSGKIELSVCPIKARKASLRC